MGIPVGTIVNYQGKRGIVTSVGTDVQRDVNSGELISIDRIGVDFGGGDNRMFGANIKKGEIPFDIESPIIENTTPDPIRDIPTTDVRSQPPITSQPFITKPKEVLVSSPFPLGLLLLGLAAIFLLRR